MPKNNLFSFNVLLGGVPVPEYEKDGLTMVMTNLMHATTYKEERLEFVDDREERQQIPVTPYQISIALTSTKILTALAKLHIDGSFVRGVVVKNGQKCVVKGFEDGNTTREFLFTLPRFGRNKDDHIEADRISKVGSISIELFEALFLRNETRKHSGNKVDFMQATKDDATVVTKGAYTMATTKVGRCIEDVKDIKTNLKRKRDEMQEVRILQYGKKLGNLELRYHMRHTLVDMGIKVLE